MNKYFMENAQIKAVSVPVDMNTAAITGERVALAKGEKCAIILSMGDSTSAVVEFTLKQHNAASAGTSKALAVANPYFVKAAAATYFTKVQPTTSESVYTLSTTFADEPGIVVFEVKGEDCDSEGGFNWISVDVTDSTAAKILGSVYVLEDLKNLPAYATVI